MKLISFEGIDASGKKTQAELLKKYLTEQGYKVELESFPRYETPIGSLIKKALADEIKITPEALHMLYEVDRVDFTERLEQLEKLNYDFVILDRYTHSNIAFGVAHNISYNWLSLLQSYIRKPDITFLLDITVEESVRRRNIRRDKFEEDLDYLDRVRRAYTILAKNNPSIILMWMGKSSPEQINEVIIDHLRRKKFIK